MGTRELYRIFTSLITSRLTNIRAFFTQSAARMTTALDSYAEHATRSGPPRWTRDEEGNAPVGRARGGPPRARATRSGPSRWARTRRGTPRWARTRRGTTPRTGESHTHTRAALTRGSTHTSNALAGRGRGAAPTGRPPSRYLLSREPELGISAHRAPASSIQAAPPFFQRR